MRPSTTISTRSLAWTLGLCVSTLNPASLARGTPALPTIPAAVFNITNYGAISGGVATNTTAIQNTINAALSAGGGTVEVPAGTFLCGPLTLGSQIRFKLDAGATLLLPPYGSYPGGTSPPDFITVTSAHDLEFCGPGMLNGQGAGWWASGIDISQKPYELHLTSCARVFIHDWNSMNPPMKHIVFDGIDSDITVQNTTNTAPYPTPNTDCLNLQGTSCLIQNCVFYGGDDNIAMGRSSGPGVNILITNITCGTGHGISIGSITKAGISNVTVVNCTFNGTDYGLRLKADNDRGGVVQNITYANIGLTNVKSPILIYGYYNEGKSLNVSPQLAASYGASNVTSLTPIWRNITFSNITATSTADAGLIWGRTEMLVSNVTLNHVTISAPASFNIYNARGISLLDSRITTPVNSSTFALYNAHVTISNSAPAASAVSLTGLTSSNSLSLYNAPATMTTSDAYGANPITLSGSTLTNKGALTLPSSTALKFVLGTNATSVTEIGNLTLYSTLNLTNGSGFGPGTYTLFTYSGSLSGSPVLGATPAGYNCSLNTNTPGQITLVASLGTPSIGNIKIAGGGVVISGAGGPNRGNYYALASTNIALPLSNWARLATNQFDASGNFSFTNLLNPNAPWEFFRLRLP